MISTFDLLEYMVNEDLSVNIFAGLMHGIIELNAFHLK